MRHRSWRISGFCCTLCTIVVLLASTIHLAEYAACSSVLVADFRMTRMVELSSRPPYCKVHSDRGDIQRMLLASDSKKMRQVPRESVVALEEVCSEASGISGELQGGLGFIYPGTKWCGPGSIAANYSDVGRYAAEDQCCREHDLCPNILLPGECRRGLCNRGPFTRSHCDCDARFRRCLQNLNTETANTLGAIFFNVVQVTCFGERRPCSVWQRDDYTGSTECQMQFYRSGTFQLPYNIGKYVTHNTLRNSRSFDTGSSNDVHSSSRLKFDSFGLISQNLFKDLFVRPLNGYTRYFLTTKSIVYEHYEQCLGTSVPNYLHVSDFLDRYTKRANMNGSCVTWRNQNYHIGKMITEADELCSRWKYRPSEKYVPIMQQKSNK